MFPTPLILNMLTDFKVLRRDIGDIDTIVDDYSVDNHISDSFFFTHYKPGAIYALICYLLQSFEDSSTNRFFDMLFGKAVQDIKNNAKKGD